MIITHNMSSIQALKHLSNTWPQQSQSIARLSTGYRINSANDDAAGLTITEKMRSQIRGLDQASTNSQDGISLLQVADGAMDEIQSILDRSYELSVKAANDTYTQQDREKIQGEIKELINELNSIYQNTEFNTKKILQGSGTQTITQVDTIVEKYYEEETVWKTQGKLPTFITSDEFKTGSLSSTIEMWETMYERTNERITRVDALGNESDVEQVTNDKGVIYKKGSPYITDKITSEKMQITGDDGFTYNIYRKFVETPQKQVHHSSFIDFSKVNKDNISELNQTGFQTTCCTCDKRYSIKFVNDQASSVKKDGTHFVYYVNIKDVETSEDLLNRIIDILGKKSNGSSNPTHKRVDTTGKEWTVVVPEDHYTGMAIETDAFGKSTGRLLVYDYTASTSIRKPRPTQDRGILQEGFYESVIQRTEKENVNRIETTEVIEKEDCFLQIGSNANNLLKLDLPHTSLESMKITDEILITDHESANKAMSLFQTAKRYISEERSKIGAYQNRLEHIIKNLDNTSENTQTAESSIRDVNMAKESVKHAKSNILIQSVQGILAQCNQQHRQVLSLLQF